MKALERKINGTFSPVPGGYAQQINEQTTLFVPDFSAARYDPKTGELFDRLAYAPIYRDELLPDVKTWIDYNKQCAPECSIQCRVPGTSKILYA